MDAYKSDPGYQKPVLSNPTGIFHLLFNIRFRLKAASFQKLLFSLDAALWRTWKGQAVCLRNAVLTGYLENRTASDSVPTHMYEPN